MFKKTALLSLIIISLAFFACSKDKKEAVTQKKGLIQKVLNSHSPQLIDKIPANAIAFYSLSADKDNDAFNRFQSSPYSQQANFINKLLSQKTKNPENFGLTVVEKISKSILNPWVNHGSKTSEGLAIATKDDENKVESSFEVRFCN